MRSEWDETKQHDVLFLLTVQPPDQVALGALRDRGEEPTPAQQHGLVYVRGAEVIEVSSLGMSASFAAPCHHLASLQHVVVQVHAGQVSAQQS